MNIDLSETEPTIEGRSFDDLTRDPRPAAKVLRHRLVRRSFEVWCKYRMAKEDRKPARHHLFIIRVIEALLNGTLGKRNVMFLMPPGAAKSTYTSKLLSAWFCNQFPNDLMLACSYNKTLVAGFGAAARDMVETESTMLGVKLSKTRKAEDDWRLENGNGGYFCAGVNAGIAGHRAMLGLIDDFCGSEEDANSQSFRDKNFTWYTGDFLPRLLPQAFQIIIANSRNEDDLVHRLIAREPDDWLVIKLPMIAGEDDLLGRLVGERLWPEWFTEKQVERAKRDPRTWAALYQQNPRPEAGNWFDKDSILTYSASELPRLSELNIYAASDWALRENQQNDRNCHLLAGMDSNGRLWILPRMFWKRCNTLVASNSMFDLNKDYSPRTWWAGRENITGSIGPFVQKEMHERQNFIPIVELSEAKDKTAKASAFRTLCDKRMVMFPGFITEWDLILDELLSFPNGKHDDWVDAAAKFGKGLESIYKAERTPEALVREVVLPPQRLDLNWLEKSSRNRERRMMMN